MSATLRAIRRLTWVAWRQHRTTLAIVLILYAAADLGVLFGPRGYATVSLVLSAVAGALAGAPMIARDLESGTARFAWTQGYPRMRIVVVAVVLVAAILAVAALSLGLVIESHFALNVGWRLGPDHRGFDVYAPLLVCWTLACYGVAMLLGIVCRSTITAIGATAVMLLVAGYGVSVWAYSLSWWPEVLLAGGAICCLRLALLFVRRPRIARVGVRS
jgi:ABC-type transport system involved in multi-copper enzyme maturation permease subunit